MTQKRLNYKALILSLILLAAVSFWAFQQYRYVTTMEFPIRAVVEDNPKLGLTANDSLEFPRIPLGTTVSRYVEMENRWGYPVKIVPEIDGDVAWRVVSPMDPVMLDIDEHRRFNVSLDGSLPEGEFFGTLTLKIYRDI